MTQVVLLRKHVTPQASTPQLKSEPVELKPIPTGPVLAPDNHRSYFPGGPISRPRSFMIFSSHHNIYNWGFPSLSHRLMPRLVAGTLAGGPPAATVSRDVSSCPTWKQKPHRHLLLPMVRCRRKPSR
ncbi:hypothetical protein PIB30_065742 [Stylosanthes scabra]|uniref:Uncharacterized protein n=1 Tax=Stylosanthes scabra TaxID=79078 RepID=A0ABU6TLY6_9FABA|nr:hypothetical protein [Stylosanthes scabra]